MEDRAPYNVNISSRLRQVFDAILKYRAEIEVAEKVKLEINVGWEPGHPRRLTCVVVLRDYVKS